MKNKLRVLILAVVFVSVLSMMPGQVSACGDFLEVKVKYAGYLDLDNDGSQDDILTVYKLEIEDTITRNDKIIIVSDLVLPSGHIYSHEMLIDEAHNEWIIVIGWFNCATESGWYTIQVSAWIDGHEHLTLSYDELAFDPPDDDVGGPPLIVIFIEEPID